MPSVIQRRFFPGIEHIAPDIGIQRLDDHIETGLILKQLSQASLVVCDTILAVIEPADIHADQFEQVFGKLVATVMQYRLVDGHVALQ